MLINCTTPLWTHSWLIFKSSCASSLSKRRLPFEVGGMKLPLAVVCIHLRVMVGGWTAACGGCCCPWRRQLVKALCAGSSPSSCDSHKWLLPAGAHWQGTQDKQDWLQLITLLVVFSNTIPPHQQGGYCVGCAWNSFLYFMLQSRVGLKFFFDERDKEGICSVCGVGGFNTCSFVFWSP